MLGAGDLREHLLGRNGHHLFHVAHAGAGERNQHVGHGDVDLRLFLARRHQHGKRAEQKGHQRQQRVICAPGKRRNAPRNAHALVFLFLHGGPFSVRGWQTAGRAPRHHRGHATEHLDAITFHTAQADLAQQRPAAPSCTYRPVISARRTMAETGTVTRWPWSAAPAVGSHRRANMPGTTPARRRAARRVPARCVSRRRRWAAPARARPAAIAARRAGWQFHAHGVCLHARRQRLRHGGRYAQAAGVVEREQVRPGMAMSPSCTGTSATTPP